MQLLAAETARRSIMLLTRFLLASVMAALLACGPVAQPTPENTGILPAMPNTPIPTPTVALAPAVSPEPAHTTAPPPTATRPLTPVNTPVTPPPIPVDTPLPPSTPARNYPKLSPTTEKPAAEPTPSPGGDSKTTVETYAAVRIWTCTGLYSPATEALIDWLRDHSVDGWPIILWGENYIIADRVASSLMDRLSQRDGVFGVDHIQETPPPIDYQGGEVMPPPPPIPAPKYPKLDTDLDSLVLAFMKCPGAAWPDSADPQVPVEVWLRDNPDTASTRAVVSWLKANGIASQDIYLYKYKAWAELYGDGSFIILYQFPASLLLPLSEQSSVLGISKYVTGVAHPAQ